MGSLCGRSLDRDHCAVPALQEDYHKLLTKYAEAENTIDQLRLGAKVRLGWVGEVWACPVGWERGGDDSFPQSASCLLAIVEPSPSLSYHKVT